MTHRLLLLRHAKSSWDDPSMPDWERPLAKRGRVAADRIGPRVREERPDLVLCSTSRRTRETLELLGIDDVATDLDEALYGAGGDELRDRLRRVPESAASVLVIGHNPGVQDLAVELTGRDRGQLAGRVRTKYPTGALAVFEIDGAWRELGPVRAVLVSFVAPRDLG